MKYKILFIITGILLIITLSGCSMSVSGKGDLQSNAQQDRTARLIHEQELEKEQIRINAQKELDAEVERRLSLQLMTMNPQYSGSYRSVSRQGPITRWVEVNISADADGPENRDIVVSCGKSYRMDGSNSISDAGIDNIIWTTSQGSFSGSDTLYPIYYAPSCPAGPNMGGSYDVYIALTIEDTYKNKSKHEKCIQIAEPFVAEPRIEAPRAITLPKNNIIRSECYSNHGNTTDDCIPQNLSYTEQSNVDVNILREQLRQEILSEQTVSRTSDPESFVYEPHCLDATYRNPLTEYITTIGFPNFKTCSVVPYTDTWMRADYFFQSEKLMLIESTRTEEINEYVRQGYTVLPISKTMINRELNKESVEIAEFLTENLISQDRDL